MFLWDASCPLPKSYISVWCRRGIGQNLPFPDDWGGAIILQPLTEVLVYLTVAEITYLEEFSIHNQRYFHAKTTCGRYN